MTTTLTLTDTLQNTDLLPMLTTYKMLPQLQREVLIDHAIASISCTEEETAAAYQQFCQQHQLTSEADVTTWLICHKMTRSQLTELVTRSLRIEKFKQAQWGHTLESYFLKRKGQLDRVVYSLLRVKDPGIVQELYFRIQGREITFYHLAELYSQGPEAHTGGFCGPVELGTLPPPIARLLIASQPGELCKPIRLGEWFAIVRLERLLPAQFDEAMRQRLLNERFNQWVQEQMRQGNDTKAQAEN